MASLPIEIDLTIGKSDEWPGAMAMLDRLRQRDPAALQQFWESLGSGRELIAQTVEDQITAGPVRLGKVNITLRPSEKLLRFLVAQESQPGA